MADTVHEFGVLHDPIRVSVEPDRGVLYHAIDMRGPSLVCDPSIHVAGTAPVALHGFDRLIECRLEIPYASPWFWLLAIGFLLVTGLLAGSYPAFYLSAFRPVKVLKGIFRAGRGATLPRQVLVTLQFTVSLSLIIGTIVVFRQIQVAKDRPIGYTREGLITVPINTDTLQHQTNALRNELLATGMVANVAESSLTIDGIVFVIDSGFAKQKVCYPPSFA